MSAATAPVAPAREANVSGLQALLRRNAWTISLLVFLGILLAFTKFIQPTYGAINLQGLAISIAAPLAFVAVGQAIVILSGGIDLSVGAMVALINCIAAVAMLNQSAEFGVGVAIAMLILGTLMGALNGTLVVVTRIADIIVTLAMSFVWAGAALLVLQVPGGKASSWLASLATGSIGSEWLPKAAIELVVIIALIWIPLRRSKVGLSLYAIGSNRLAAFRSGVPVGRTKIISYALAGLFAAIGGLAVTANTSIGTPLVGGSTLASVAGGRGGVVGPVIGVIILALIRADMTFMGINSNLATVTNGVILIAVVMVGSLASLRRSRA
jgi:ribose transport system permease protein